MFHPKKMESEKMPRFYAEDEVDRLVRENFFADYSKTGVFVDVGAAGPEYLSMSRHFRDNGWQVISVEPNPHFCEQHRQMGQRVLEYAVGMEDRDDVPFQLVHSRAQYHGGTISYESFSSLAIKDTYRSLQPNLKCEAVKVKLRRLDTILLEHTPHVDKVDVLSIDVEGWELEVLAGFSIDKYRPSVMIIENLFDEPKYAQTMSQLGYDLWHAIAPNQIYVRRDWDEWQRFQSADKLLTSKQMPKVMLISNPAQQCGVREFGKTTSNLLARSRKFALVYHEYSETATPQEFLAALHLHAPDVVIYNYHPLTMRWLTNDLMTTIRRSMPGIKHVGIAHDEAPPFPQMCAVVHIDPTFVETPREFAVPRPIPVFNAKQDPPPNVIGSFGLGSHHKGFHRVVERVNSEFDQATVRLHIPFSSYGDPYGEIAREIGEDCKRRAKPGVTVEVSHNYKSKHELLEWLAGNTINCFLYDRLEGSGPSSALDLALAVRRPMALSDSYMFRHVTGKYPGVMLENSSLRENIAAGFAPLEPLYREWSEERLIERYEEIVASVLKSGDIDVRGNRVITTSDQRALESTVTEMTRLCRESGADLNAEFILQEAFLFEQIKRMIRRTDKVLVIHDPASASPLSAALTGLGYQIELSEFPIGHSGATAPWKKRVSAGPQYDFVVANSVLDRVANDELFLSQLIRILKSGGMALLTANYDDGSGEATTKSVVSNKRYDAKQLHELLALFPQAEVLDVPSWELLDRNVDSGIVDTRSCSLAFRKSAPRVEKMVDVIARTLLRVGLARDEALVTFRLARCRDVMSRRAPWLARQFKRAFRVAQKVMRLSRRLTHRVGL